MAADVQGRERTGPWRKLYKTARWQKIRKGTFIRDLFTCQRCGRLEGNTSKLVCNHVTPHRGNEQAFWAGPFETVCSSCHSSIIQKEEQASLQTRGVWN